MSTIDRVFVIRRTLHNGIVHKSSWAHSALLLHTTNKETFVLEYMDDAKVYLTKATCQVIADKSDHEVITIAGTEWTKQKTGKVPSGIWTPESAKKKMQELMAAGYSAWKAEHCHTAQERLRKAMDCF